MRQLWSPLAHCGTVVFDLAGIRTTQRVELGFRRRRTTGEHPLQRPGTPTDAPGERPGAASWAGPDAWVQGRH
jgi:hypothetical protein